MTDLAAGEFEPGSAARVMLGRESGGMLVYDLESQKAAAKVMQQSSRSMLSVWQNYKQMPTCHTHPMNSHTRPCRWNILTAGSIPQDNKGQD